MMRRKKGNKGGDGGVGAAAVTSAPVMSACTRRMPGKEPQGEVVGTEGCGFLYVCCGFHMSRNLFKIRTDT